MRVHLADYKKDLSFPSGLVGGYDVYLVDWPMSLRYLFYDMHFFVDIMKYRKMYKHQNVFVLKLFEF